MFSLLNEVVAYVDRNNSVRAAKNSAMSDHDLHNDNIRRIIDYFLKQLRVMDAHHKHEKENLEQRLRKSGVCRCESKTVQNLEQGTKKLEQSVGTSSESKTAQNLINKLPPRSPVQREADDTHDEIDRLLICAADLAKVQKMLDDRDDQIHFLLQDQKMLHSVQAAHDQVVKDLQGHQNDLESASEQISALMNDSTILKNALSAGAAALQAATETRDQVQQLLVNAQEETNNKDEQISALQQDQKELHTLQAAHQNDLETAREGQILGLTEDKNRLTKALQAATETRDQVQELLVNAQKETNNKDEQISALQQD